MIQLVIPGNPVSQKNSHEIHRHRRTGRRSVGLSPRVKAYRDAAILEIKKQWKSADPIDRPVVVWYRIFRSDHRRQDLGNAMEAVWDALQAARVVENDSLIIPRGVGPIMKDPNPRVELHLELWYEECHQRFRL